MERVEITILISTLLFVLVKCFAPCLTWNILDKKLVLTCRVTDYSETVTILDNKGNISASCGLGNDCSIYTKRAKVVYNSFTREVTMTLDEIDKNKYGIWTCVIGDNRYSTAISETEDMIHSTKLSIVGEVINQSSVNITCFSCRVPLATWVEFLVNNKSDDTITYERENQLCFNKYKECTKDVCSCTSSGNSFTRIFPVHQSEKRLSFSCYAKFLVDDGEKAILFGKLSTIVLYENGFLPNERTTETFILHRGEDGLYPVTSQDQLTDKPTDFDDMPNQAWLIWLLVSLCFVLLASWFIFCSYIQCRRQRDTTTRSGETVPLVPKPTNPDQLTDKPADFDDMPNQDEDTTTGIGETVPLVPKPTNPELSMAIQDHDTIVLHCQLPDSTKITTVGWIFRSGTTVKNISTTLAEKYNYSVLSPSLIIKNCEASDSGTYELIVNSLYTSDILVDIPAEIYREPINAVPYYQETKQLKEIERALRIDDKKLVILKGIPGSGKTQAASKFCERYRMMYSIVANISLRDGSSFKQSLLELLEDKLGWKCTSNDREISFEAVVGNFQNYLNHGHRKNLPFVLVVDNIGPENVPEITNFVSLIERVSRLNIILAVTNEEYTSVLTSNCHSLIEFNGMDMDEYMGLFNHLLPGGNADDFKNLVDVIGSTPIILATVLIYIDNISKVSASNLEIYSSKEIPAMKAISSYIDAFHGTNDPALTSQLFSLERIRGILGETNRPGNYCWKVLNLIPFLDYDAVSSDVLQACYRHLSNTLDEKKSEIMFLVNLLSKFYLCQFFFVSRPGVGTKEPGVMYRFHKVTINSIESMKEKSPYDRNLNFLLKLFCSEIDIDAGSDITVARNLLFVPHAKKLLLGSGIESDWSPSREQKFLISYLYCAIGTTLLYDKQKFKSAYFFLMKAHHFALTVIGRKLFASAEDVSLRQDFPCHVADNVADCIGSTFQDILKCELNLDFAKDFVLSKRRNKDEVTNIRKAVREKAISKNDFKINNICENHYLTMEEYNELEKLNLALSIEDLSKILLAELVLNILFSKAKALDLISYAKGFAMDEQDEQKEQHPITGIDTEVEISQTFCDNLKKLLYERLELDKKVQLFVCLQSDSIGPLLTYKYSGKSSDTPVDIKIACYEELLENKQTDCFDFGVIKLPKERFTSYCLGNIIEYFNDKIEQEKNDQTKKKIYAEGRNKVNTLMNRIQQMKDGDKNDTWLLRPWLYLKCGKFLSQADRKDCADLLTAIDCFDDVLEFERSREAFWSLYIFEAYRGKIRCLQKLNNNSEVERVNNELTKMVRDQNRDEYLSYI